MANQDSILAIENRANELADGSQWGAAARALLRAAKAEPQNTARWLKIAEWQRLTGDSKAAIRTLETALRMNPAPAESHAAPQHTSRSRHTGPSLQDIVTLWQTLAEVQLEAQDWEACVEACYQVLELSPRHHLVQEILATALLQQGQLEAAEQVMRNLLMLSPRDPLHRLRLATLLQLEGRLGAAVEEYTRVAESYPELSFVQEANEAIEMLDRMQTQQILMRAHEQPAFRMALERNLDEVLAENGFSLSDSGYEALRHMVWDGRYEEDPEVPLPRIH
jgi:tetratricopeptide (TPR) repeat protein